MEEMVLIKNVTSDQYLNFVGKNEAEIFEKLVDHFLLTFGNIGFTGSYNKVNIGLQVDYGDGVDFTAIFDIYRFTRGL